ncbi:MAG: hypothetical protein PVJ34_07585 [Anaerolineae bacterium]|jgi:hypothetical protein
MFNPNQPITFLAVNGAANSQRDTQQRPVQSALHLFDRACTRGWLHRLWSALTRRSNRLLDLDDVKMTCEIHNRCYAGIQAVSLDQIRGSEGRCRDFDAAFHPRQNHNKGRWLNVAIARQTGTSLPPVALVQIEDVYFVTDGHHRISVARALGQKCIEAEVVIWQVTGPLPWATSTAAQDRNPRRSQQAMEPA